MAALLPAAIAAMLDEAARRYEIPPALLRGVAWVESRGRADAVSRAGAMGVLQLMPQTAEGLGVADPFDPPENIDGGARFLKRLIDRFGSVEPALAAYNWGPRRVADGRPWPQSVRGYVRKVLDRADVEEQILATTDDSRLAWEHDGSRAAVDPFDPDLQGGPPWPLAAFPPPHCRSCTCSTEGEDGDT